VSRLSALAAHPRRTVGALAVVLAAVGITVGSGANFTARAANPANTFTAGTLSIDNSKGNGSSATAVLSAPNLKPGDSAPGVVDIQNSGSLAGAFTLSTGTASDSTGVSLLGQLDVRIEDCGVWTTVNSTPTAPACGSGKVLTASNAKLNGVGQIDLGSFAASEKHRYKFDVTLPASTDNTFQSKSASIAFNWDAQTT
jgi:spore coat-associated protein N